MFISSLLTSAVSATANGWTQAPKGQTHASLGSLCASVVKGQTLAEAPSWFLQIKTQILRLTFSVPQDLAPSCLQCYLMPQFSPSVLMACGSLFLVLCYFYCPTTTDAWVRVILTHFSVNSPILLACGTLPV